MVHVVQGILCKSGGESTPNGLMSCAAPSWRMQRHCVRECPSTANKAQCAVDGTSIGGQDPRTESALAQEAAALPVEFVALRCREAAAPGAAVLGPQPLRVPFPGGCRGAPRILCELNCDAVQEGL